MGAIQRGTSWATIPKTLNRARTVHAPCAHRARTVRQRPQRRPQERLDGRLEEVAKAVGGGCYRLQMPLRLALGVRGTVAGHRLGALEGGGGLAPFQCIPGPLLFAGRSSASNRNQGHVPGHIHVDVEGWL